MFHTLLWLSVAAAVATSVHGNHGTCLQRVQRSATHNSYHVAAPDAVLALLKSPSFAALLGNDTSGDGGLALWGTSLPDLPTQLSGGVGAVELDLFPDPQGGAYQYSAALKALGVSDGVLPEPDWREPGIKVMHVTDADFQTSCILLSSCLEQLRNWSDSRSGRHLPITVYFELKGADATVANLLSNPNVAPLLSSFQSRLGVGPPPNNFTEAVPWALDGLTDLQSTILDVFNPSQLILPEDVQLGNASLAKALLDSPDCRWPSVADSLGKFAFVFLRTPANAMILDAYTAAVRNGTIEPLIFLEQQGKPTNDMVVFNEADGDIVEQSAVKAAVDRGMIVRAYAGRVPTDKQVTAMLNAGVNNMQSDVVPGPTGDGAALRDMLVANGFNPRCMARCSPVAAAAAGPACADLAAVCNSL